MAIKHTTPADGTFSAAGAAAWNADHTGSAEVVFADSPNSNIDLTNGGGGGAVTIISASVTGISAGDQIVLDAWISILNNSGGATVTYTHVVSLGSVSLTAAPGAGQAASATSRSSRKFNSAFGITSSSLASVLIAELGGNIVNANAGVNAGVNFCCQGWNTSASDATGSQTFTWTISGSSAAGTQTLTLHNYSIRKIAKI